MPVWQAICSMCRQPTLAQFDVAIGQRVVWIGVCSDCDAGHCPRCRRHLAMGERFCTECGTELSLRDAHTQAAE